MKRLVVLLLGILLVSGVSAQEQKYSVNAMSDTLKKLNVNYMVGTSFSTDLKSGSAFSSYFSSKLNYSLSNKLNLELIPTVTSSSFSNYKLWTLGSYAAILDDKINVVSLSGQANYKLSDKTYIGSSLFFEQNVNHFDGYRGTPVQNINAQSINFFVGHEFSPNFKVEIGVSMNRYNNPAYMDALPLTTSPRW